MINLGIAYFTNTDLPFIASVVIGTIQLGATVDYAILMTTRYRTERYSGKDKKEAVGIALNTSIKSIVTSALGFFAATVGVAVLLKDRTHLIALYAPCTRRSHLDGNSCNSSPLAPLAPR